MTSQQSKLHYSYIGMLEYPEKYSSLVAKGKSSTTYKEDKKEYIKNILRFIGEALCDKKVTYDILVNTTSKHLYYLNHFKRRVKYYEPRAEALIERVKSEQRFNSKTMLLIPVDKSFLIKCLMQKKRFKYSEFKLYVAFLLLSKALEPEDKTYIIWKPSALYRLANINPKTYNKYSKNLEKRGLIKTDRGKYNCINFEILDDIISKYKLIESVLRPLLKSPKNVKFQKLDTNWLEIHNLCTPIDPIYTKQWKHPLIYKKLNVDNKFQFQFGIITIEEIFFTLFGEVLFNETKKFNLNKSDLKPDSAFMQIDNNAIKKSREISKKYPYKIDNNLNNKYLSLLKDYKIRADKAATRGLPFNISSAKAILFPLRYGCKQRKSSKSNEYLLETLEKYINKNNTRLKCRWDIRGSVSNRTQTRNPNLQGMPKTIRYLLTDKESYTFSYDISGFETYIALTESGETYNPNDNIFQEIADDIGIGRKLVKNVINPRLKGAGEGTILQDLHKKSILRNGKKVLLKDVDEIISKFYDKFPKVEFRKTQLKTNGESPNGIVGTVPNYNLQIINFSDEGASTAGIAHLDQTIGSTIVKLWLVEYSKTAAGKKYPVVLDWHDNLTIEVPKEQLSEVRTSILDDMKESLRKSISNLKYSMPPKLKVEDHCNIL